MIFSKLFVAGAFTVSSIIGGASAIYTPGQKNNTVVYWGQNAFAGDTQANLTTTCSSPDVDIVVVSFVTKIFSGKSGLPVINLSNQCGGYIANATHPEFDTDVLYCPHIGDQIKECQAIGKKILLSIGGATYQEKGWKDAPAARSTANTLWSMFGPNNAYPYRPFGTAGVDGFDIDFEYEVNKPNTEAFAKQLIAKFGTDKKKTYMLTAAPQCPNPDKVLDTALTTVPFDAVFIQFYNNACGAQSFSKGKTTAYNLKAWQTWATTKSNNKNIKLFVGFLAGGIANQVGYVTRTKAGEIVTDAKQYANFAGASFWDSSILNANTGYLASIKATLNKTPIKKRSLEADAVEVEEPAVVERDHGMSLRKKRHFHQHHRRGF